MVTGYMHHLFGMHMPDAPDGGFFTPDPYGNAYAMLQLWNYVGVDLSGASFGPTRYPTIKYIKDAALHAVTSLESPNMDRIDVYQNSASPLNQARHEGEFSRGWPALGDPANPAPEHADDWKQIGIVYGRLQASRREGGGFVLIPFEVVLTRADIKASLQIVGFTPGTASEPDADGETRIAIVIDVTMRIDLRLRLDNWPKLPYNPKVKKSWLDPGDPDYLTEIETTWVQDGVSGCSVNPGIRTADGLGYWNVAGERAMIIDTLGPEATYRPLPYFPTEFRWQGELGPLTNPAWPDVEEYIGPENHVGCRLARDIIRRMRPIMVPARKTRVQGTAAPEVYQGSAGLQFAVAYSDAELDDYCPEP